MCLCMCNHSYIARESIDIGDSVWGSSIHVLISKKYKPCSKYINKHRSNLIPYSRALKGK